MKTEPYSRKHSEAGFIKQRLDKCRYCGGEIPERRRTFCSGRATRYTRLGFGCVHKWLLRTNPGYARRCVWIRDRGKCAICGKICLKRGKYWQADHIIPVIEGGADFGLDNLRTLCTECHKQESAKLAANRAFRKRSWKQIGKMLNNIAINAH